MFALTLYYIEHLRFTSKISLLVFFILTLKNVKTPAVCRIHMAFIKVDQHTQKFLLHS